jgi:hypothetical protein
MDLTFCKKVHQKDYPISFVHKSSGIAYPLANIEYLRKYFARGTQANNNEMFYIVQRGRSQTEETPLLIFKNKTSKLLRISIISHFFKDIACLVGILFGMCQKTIQYPLATAPESFRYSLAICSFRECPTCNILWPCGMRLLETL